MSDESSAQEIDVVSLGILELGREPSDASRLRALAQLNASLADELFSSSARRAGFDAYHARLPFGAEARDVMQKIADRSLAHAHRWRGEDCELAGARRS